MFFVGQRTEVFSQKGAVFIKPLFVFFGFFLRQTTVRELSPYTHSTTKPSSHKQSPTTPTTKAPTTAIDSRFIFFAVNFLPDLFYSMTIIFWFFCFIIVLPFSVLFFYFCWLRIWGNNEPPAATNIPLRERLGSLPPVPEQQ